LLHQAVVEVAVQAVVVEHRTVVVAASSVEEPSLLDPPLLLGPPAEVEAPQPHFWDRGGPRWQLEGPWLWPWDLRLEKEGPRLVLEGEPKRRRRRRSGRKFEPYQVYSSETALPRVIGDVQIEHAVLRQGPCLQPL
jgi:hypothetical protein